MIPRHLLPLCLACLPMAAFGHGDASIPLYVAADGSDSSRCADPATPCRTLGHALRQAGKGTQIRVAAGRYAIEDAGDVVMLISGIVDVVGGYRREDGFTVPGGALSTLTGVPAGYRAELQARGFHVIADRKGDGEDVATLLSAQKAVAAGAPAATCSGGQAGGLACDRVDLVAHLPFSAVSAAPSRANDVWGFRDLNTGREYVLAGFNRGTAVIDISDPAAPREVGFVQGQSASWRDIKVFQRYDETSGRFHAWAYVTTDGASDGLFVIDLAELPQRVRRVDYPSQFSSAHNIHASSTDFATGLPNSSDPRLIVGGSNLGAGQYRAYGLDAPAAPAFVTGSSVPNTIDGSDSSYMHDAASMLVTDSRKDTQCANAGSACEVLFDFNEQNAELWDISDIGNPVHLNAGRQPYAQLGYVHSGWWSEDRQYLFVHDELDEQRFNLNTTLRIFSLSDLRSPTLAGSWTGPTGATDHNGFVRGNRYYMSNYSRGLTVLDITDPTNPQAAGFLDTYPVSNQAGFIGAWGAYPFFDSGIVAVNDISSGVYLVRDRSRDVAAGSLGFSAASAAVIEGNPLQLGVMRSGGTSGAAAVTIEVLPVTADAADYSLATTTLSWNDGDGSAKNVDLTALADGVAEGLEAVILRLVNPTGGATLTDAGSATVHLEDPGAAATVRAYADRLETAERGFARAVVVLQRDGSATGPASVDYVVSGGDATPGTDFTGATSGTVSWADGDAIPKWIEFAVVDDGGGESDETIELTLANASGATLQGAGTINVTIRDGSGGNSAPNAIVATGLFASEQTPVTLDGSQSVDPDGDVLTFAWSQVSGPTVALATPAESTTQFITPSVSGDSVLQFRLTVTDPDGLTDAATATVTVTDNRVTGGGGGGSGAWLLLCLPLLVRLIRRDDA